MNGPDEEDDGQEDFALEPVVLDVRISRRETFEGYLGEDDLDAEWAEDPL